MQPPIADTIGKYKVVGELGRGAMGVVFIGHDPDLDRRVALKVMAANIQQDTDLEQRFRREAQAVARLQSPNIVTVYDFGYHQGSPYFAMELLEGGDLESRLRHAPPSLSEKLNIVIQVCHGLAQAHAQGVIHRDIKPANLFVTTGGLVKIMDFGTARLVQSSQTQTGTVMGTVAYMSPEQLKGEKVDGRSDLFSLGVVLYRLLCHQQPFPGENIHNIIYKILHIQPASLALPVGSQVPPLQLIVDRALTKEADRRYQSADEMARDLEAFLRQHTGSLAEDTVFRTVTAGDAPPAAITTDQRTMPVGGQATLPAAADATVPVVEGAAQVAQASTPPGAEDSDFLEGATVISRPDPGSGGRHDVESKTRPDSGSGATPAMATAAKTGRPWLPWLAGAAALAVVAVGIFFLGRPDATETSGTETPAGTETMADTVDVAETSPSPPADGGGNLGVGTETGADPSAADPLPGDLPPSPTTSSGGDAARATSPLGGGTPTTPPPPTVTAPPPPRSAPPPRQTPPPPSGPSVEDLGRREAAIRTALGTGNLARAQELLDQARRDAPDHPSWELFDSQLTVAGANQRGQQHLERALSLYDTDDFAGAITAADEAKGEFEQARLLDRGNMAAFQGSKTASDLRRDAEQARDRAAAPPPPPAAVAAGRSFRAGTTDFVPADAQGATGFESDASVQAQRATRSVTTPGDLIIEISPTTVAIGDPYRIQVRLHNKSNTALMARSLELITLLRGRKVGAGQPHDLGLRRVEPGGTATLFDEQDIWTEDLEASGELEARLELARKGTLLKKITWGTP